MARKAESLEPTAESFFQGEHLPDDSDKPLSPEQLLWFAVIARCWHDAFIASDSYVLNTDRCADPDLVRGEARRWLTVDFGDYAVDREHVCDICDVDPELVRDAARKKLAEVKAAESEQRTAHTKKIDRAFLRLVAKEDAMAPGDIDAVLADLAAQERAVA